MEVGVPAPSVALQYSPIWLHFIVLEKLYNFYLKDFFIKCTFMELLTKNKNFEFQFFQDFLATAEKIMNLKASCKTALKCTTFV